MADRNEKYRALTVSQLRDRLDYDPLNGKLTWRRPGYSRRGVGAEAGNVNATTGYRIIVVGSYAYVAHKLAWLHKTGSWPKRNLDHINGDRADNRWENLRLASPGQNLFNRRKSRLNTSGHTGVTWHERLQKWRATIAINGKRYSLGCYSRVEDAAAAYNTAAQEMHGDFYLPPEKRERHLYPNTREKKPERTKRTVTGKVKAFNL